MDLRLSTWNSTNINNATPFTSYFPKGQKTNLASNPVRVSRAGDFPFLSDTVLSAPTLAIGVIIAAGQSINTNREILKKTFNITDRVKHNLVALDADDSNKSYYVTGIPTRINNIGNSENEFTVVFALEYPYWQLSTATNDNWAITGTGDTQAVTNAGNMKVPPLFTFTPTTTKSAGLSYRRLVNIYNALTRSVNFPLDITDGGIDTDALTTAKMQADGDDFRIWMDGQFADRWLNGMDTTTTRCWSNVNLQPKLEGTLGTTVNDAITTLAFTETTANLQFLKGLKRVQNQALLIESEMITYDRDNVDLVGYQITSVVRGEKGTAAAGHTAPITVRHIEHDMWILYGDSTLAAPDVDNDYKPIFDLDSDNDSLSYTYFYDTSANRPGAWKPEVQSSKTNLSYFFTNDQDTFVNPAAYLGLAMTGTHDFQIANEAGLLDWLFSHPCGMTNVLYSGDAYTYAGSWPAIVGLQYLEPDAAWFTAQNGTEPGSTSTWTAFGPHNIALGGTYEAIRFAIDGQLDSINDAKVMTQFDTVTLTVDSNNIPVISVGSEASINFFDITLTNNTTGEYLKVQTPCPVDDTLTIDCVNKKAYLSDGTIVRVTLSSDRDEWLDMNVGSNTFQFDDVGTVAVTGVVTHRDRML